MDAKEKFDALMQLANYRATIRENRRKWEWRVSFGLWAAMAAFAYNYKDILIAQPAIRLLGILVVIAAIHGWFWCWPMFVADEKDIQLAHNFAERAEHIVLGNEAPPIAKRPDVIPTLNEFVRLLTHPRATIQVVITIMLGIGIILATHSN